MENNTEQQLRDEAQSAFTAYNKHGQYLNGGTIGVSYRDGYVDAAKSYLKQIAELQANVASAELIKEHIETMKQMIESNKWHNRQLQIDLDSRSRSRY
jgi:hypothetical protein